MKKIIGLLMLVVFMAACSSGETRTRRPLNWTRQPITPRPTATTYRTRLVCEEYALNNIPIAIWETPGGSDLVGTVPHNTYCTILDSAKVRTGMVYKIHAGGYTGWVDYKFVQ
jgi:hypothetical protein